MNTTPQQIDQWIGEASEHQRLEFKEAKTQYDNKKLYRFCVAIANEGGGQFLLGITDQPPRKVVGTAAFNDPVEMAEKLFRAVGFRVDIEAVNHPDGRVIVFHIPPRPRGTAYHLEGTYFMRSGSELVPMSEDQLRRIFKEGEPDWLEEPSLKGLDEHQVIDLLDTEAYFKLLVQPYPTDNQGVIDRLIQDQLIDDDKEGFVIRRMGALLLAERLEDFSDVKLKAPRVVVYSGTSKLATKMDQSGSRGYATAFQSLVRFIMAQLPQNEVIEEGLRESVKLVPEITVRELVANALIHQDFNVRGSSVMVEIYTDRVEFSNPGEPIVPVERFIDGYQSRNDRLANLMRRMRICEEKSSGIDKVISAVESFQLPAPDFRVSHQRTVVVLFGPKDFENMDRDERIRACYQHASLKRVVSEYMTNQSLRERFHLPEGKSAIISQVMSLAIEKGVIKQDESAGQSRKYARYLPFWA